MSQVAKVEQETNLPAAVTPDQMLVMAIQKGADMAQIEKFMDLKDRWEADEAKKAFVSALNKFKENPPKISKNAEVDYTTQKGRTNFKYASLDHVCDVVGKALSDVGISYRWKTEQQEAGIRVTCVLTHVRGHDEETALTGSPDASGGKNAIQAIGSTVSYLQRYTLLTATGLAVAGSDDDGGRPEITVDDLLDYNNLVRDEFFSIAGIKKALLDKDYSAAKEALQELDHETQQALWKAPTKGGIFTTIERGQMRSEEFRQA